jgi:hypothetical protein
MYVGNSDSMPSASALERTDSVSIHSQLEQVKTIPRPFAFELRSAFKGASSPRPIDRSL